MTGVKAGDWVQVYAQVVNSAPHPAEYTVRFESHNEHYNGLVRRDHCVKTDPPVGIAGKCTALIKVDVSGQTTFIQCKRHLHHGERHVTGKNLHGEYWTFEKPDAYVEEA